MTVEDHNSIDFVATTLDGEVLLIMVEHREWGTRGALLEELQAKLNAYLSFADEQLAENYPHLAGRPVQIQLRTIYAPGDREVHFLELARQQVLAEAGIKLSWQLIRQTSDGA